MLSLIAFYTFCVLVLASFLIVVITQNILYSLSALAFGMILVSGFFFLLDAEFLGVVQIIVYTGAVVVMYAFGMMFFDLEHEVREKMQGKINLFVIVALLFIAFFVVIEFSEGKVGSKNPLLDTNYLADTLFNDYLIAFEVAAIMLLMAMIAGISIAVKKSYMVRKIREEE